MGFLLNLLGGVKKSEYEEKVEECALLRAELSALKEAVSVQSAREGAVSSTGSLEPAHI